ncbi:YHS domain-containing (seleno)protein [Pedobacter sandarakinus]|uniref:YHS domain-containing (seleno)protein n=1 Tax=Pedobacter sandarakinus TaxID=353156 RepID=UPI00224516E8|nr:YHS domain-containing (seleno)protein [Pedobacter sandarakinus]MCX2573183.1 hypothetical protein [Pedobacter sandarakinus]
MKRTLIVAALSLFILFSASAQQSEIFAPGGKAIRGFDPVAFFTQAKALKGVDTLSYQWKDVTWLFASAENMAMFKADPEKFAPQYGGYCAYGCSNNYKAPTQADTWTVVDDKLYFNYNVKVKEMWTKEQTERIKAADEKWPIIKNKG